MSCEKNGTMRNLLEQGCYYSTCGKVMNLIIRDMFCDEYNYIILRVYDAEKYR